MSEKVINGKQVVLSNGNFIKVGQLKGGFAVECGNVQGNATVVTCFTLSTEAAYALAAIITGYSRDETVTALALAGEPKPKKRARR